MVRRRKPFGQVDGNRNGGGRSVSSNASVQSQQSSTLLSMDDNEFDFLTANAAAEAIEGRPEKCVKVDKSDSIMIDSQTKTPKVSNVTTSAAHAAAEHTTQRQSYKQQQQVKDPQLEKDKLTTTTQLRGKHRSNAFLQQESNKRCSTRVHRSLPMTTTTTTTSTSSSAQNDTSCAQQQLPPKKRNRVVAFASSPAPKLETILEENEDDPILAVSSGITETTALPQRSKHSAREDAIQQRRSPREKELCRKALLGSSGIETTRDQLRKTSQSRGIDSQQQQQQQQQQPRARTPREKELRRIALGGSGAQCFSSQDEPPASTSRRESLDESRLFGSSWDPKQKKSTQTTRELSPPLSLSPENHNNATNDELDSITSSLATQKFDSPPVEKRTTELVGGKGLFKGSSCTEDTDDMELAMMDEDSLNSSSSTSPGADPFAMLGPDVGDSLLAYQGKVPTVMLDSSTAVSRQRSAFSASAKPPLRRTPLGKRMMTRQGEVSSGLPSSSRAGTPRMSRASEAPRTPESSHGGRVGGGTPQSLQKKMAASKTPVSSFSGKLAMFTRTLATSPKVPGSASLSKEPQRISLRRRRQDNDERERQAANSAVYRSRGKSEESPKHSLRQGGSFQEPPIAARGKRMSNEQLETLQLQPGAQPVSFLDSKLEQQQKQQRSQTISQSLPQSHARNQWAPAAMPKHSRVAAASAKPVSAALLKKLRELPPDDQEAINAMFASDVPERNRIGVEGLVVQVNTADEESCDASEVTCDAALAKPRQAGRNEGHQQRSKSANNKESSRAANGSVRKLPDRRGSSKPAEPKELRSELRRDERRENPGDLPNVASSRKAAVTVASTTVTRTKRRPGTPPTASTGRLNMSPTKPQLSGVTVVPPQLWTAEVAGQMNAAPVFELADGKLYRHPPMPPGWSLGISRSKNRPYYFHPDFGSTFYPPVLLPLANGDVKGTFNVTSQATERLKHAPSSGARNDWETPLSSGNNSYSEQGGNVPSSAFLVSVVPDAKSEPDNSRETPFLFRSLPTASEFSGVLGNVQQSGGHSDIHETCTKSKRSGSSFQNAQVKATPLEATTEILIAAKCARIRKARGESRVENVAEVAENWSVESLYPASDGSSPSSKLRKLWETPVVYDGSNSGEPAEDYGDGTNSSAKASGSSVMKTEKSTELQVQSYANSGDSCMHRMGAEDITTTPSESNETRDKNGYAEVAVARQSVIRTGAFADAASYTRSAAGQLDASKATTSGMSDVSGPRGESGIDYGAKMPSIERSERKLATPESQDSENYQDDSTVGPQDVGPSPHHSPNADFGRNDGFPASIDVVESVEQSPGDHGAGDDDFVASPDDDYQSPHLDNDRVDVLGRTDLISSRFVPKTRHVDDVSPLGNDTSSNFSRGSRSSATSWISRTSSMMSNLSVGSYRVQHPPMPLCCLQNVDALPVIKVSSQKRSKKRKASWKRTAKRVETKGKGRAKKSRSRLAS